MEVHDLPHGKISLPEGTQLIVAYKLPNAQNVPVYVCGSRINLMGLATGVVNHVCDSIKDNANIEALFLSTMIRCLKENNMLHPSVDAAVSLNGIVMRTSDEEISGGGKQWSINTATQQ